MDYEWQHEAADAFFTKLNEEAAPLTRQLGITSEGITSEGIIRPGYPAKVMLEFDHDFKADLIVIGQSGHSTMCGKLLGTTADWVVRSAKCSVLLVL